MSWDDLADSVRKTVQNEPVHDSTGSILFSITRLAALAGVVVAAVLVPGVAFMAVTANNVSNDLVDLPLELQVQPNPQTTRLLASDGSLLAYFYQENRQDVPLEGIAPIMQEALLSIEDNRFYEHGALDLKGTLRALVNNASDGQTQGGSSITQQLVKLTLVQQATTKEQVRAATAKSTARKIRELKLAIAYEREHTKKEILERYFNIAYFGDGAYGIRSAAYHYFSVSPDKLNTLQAATLAGLVKNPVEFDPRIYPERALQRRNTVLQVMERLGKLPSDQAEDLMAKPLGLKIKSFPNGCVASKAEFSCDYIRRYLLREPALGATLKERQARLERGGLTIKTNIDVRMQKAINKAVTSTVGAKDKAIGSMALVEPGTGKVRGIAQSKPMGRNKKKGQSFIDYSVPTRYGDSVGFQAGSTFKMFTVAAALKKGIPVSKTYKSPQNLLMRAGTYFDCEGGGVGDWPVKNSTGAGTFNMYRGTRQSVNTYFAQLERDAGLCNTVKAAQSMGIPVDTDSKDHFTDVVGPFTLGVTYVSPLDMAAAYATPASGGIYCEPMPVDQIVDQNRKVIKKYTKQCDRAMDKDVAAQINDILTGLQKPGGFGYSNGTALRIPSAAKTGTTNDNKSVWYMGYTPELVAASMIAGVDSKGKPRSLAGVTLRGVPVSFARAGGSSLAGPMWKIAMGVIQDYLSPVAFDPPPEREPRPEPKKKKPDTNEERPPGDGNNGNGHGGGIIINPPDPH
ncbi:transglycosylase domain-containing protein [Aeromicrobium terrae]|uniref:Penicillin-binding protein n=1 Tax=Aeromicrobium terrae TaxID=2498846 RepID=A0A5C8NHJ4_9ACTN|nr:transglycosylase domain-containing protein [Aeromicrobium terrae]TXL60650.1 penicillin-binding protein [Aeromicrobium terrae]